MERFRKLAENRFKWLEKNQNSLFDLIRNAESSLYKELIKYILDLDIDSKGNLKSTAKNVKTLKTVNQIIDKFNKTKNVSIVRQIIEKVKDLLGLNAQYFDSVAAGVETIVESKARRAVFNSLGYNEVKNTITEGGYLWQLAKGSDLAGQIAIQVNQAITAKLPLKEFQKQFFDRFVNPQGLGMLERHFYTFSFDLMQRVDRQVQITYADDLKLKYFIYSGTKISTTRPFCEARFNKLYTRDEAEKWKNLKFQGKPKVGYEPLRDAAGYNCRHTINFISNELAEELIKTEGVNQYRAVAPKPKGVKNKKSIFK